MAFLNKSLLALSTCALIGSAFASDARAGASAQLSESPDNPSALVALAIKHEHAEGVPQDYAKAADLYCRAARSGYADAQYALGWMYANGRGVPRNDSVAAQLFSLAGDQGHTHAREMLRHIRSSIQVPLPSCLLPEKSVIEATPEQPQIEATIAQAEAADEVIYLKGPIFKLVHQLAPKYKIDPKLALAIISVESGFNVHAKSPKNAQGLMQLIPETAERFNVKDAFDPAENIKGGLAYLQWLLSFFKGNVTLVAAAYNAGERAVEKYSGIPPYPETRDYVRKITQLYRNPTHPYRSNYTEVSSIAMLSASYRK